MNFKTIGLIALLALLMFVGAKVLADVKGERIKLKISENCAEKVEEIAESVEGVIETHWHEETGELEIIYQQDETSMQKIEQTISEAGFDTPNYKASEKAAENIPDECKEMKSVGY